MRFHRELISRVELHIAAEMWYFLLHARCSGDGGCTSGGWRGGPNGPYLVSGACRFNFDLRVDVPSEIMDFLARSYLENRLAALPIYLSGQGGRPRRSVLDDRPSSFLRSNHAAALQRAIVELEQNPDSFRASSGVAPASAPAQ